jgi:hypothetical protein
MSTLRPLRVFGDVHQIIEAKKAPKQIQAVKLATTSLTFPHRST